MDAPLETVTLENGPLRFRALAAGGAAPPDAPIVLCLHGFPDDPRTFRHQLPAFAAAGHRALAPWLRGYEPSSQPVDGDYTLEALAGDVVAWIDGLGAERVHLVGHDWGAAIAYVAGALAPERFHSIATIAVPHAARLAEGIRRVPSQLLKSWYMMFFQLRGVADHFVARDDWALVRRLWRDWSPDYRLSDEEWAALRDTFAAPGVARAMLAYYRQNLSAARAGGADAARRTTVPVRTLALTGADDGCIDTRLYDHVFHDADFPAGVRVERIPAAGHFVHLERPELVTRMLLDWFAAGAPDAPGAPQAAGARQAAGAPDSPGAR